jgi:archaeal flagellar protein FlaG
MAQNVISTAILIIAAVIATVALINGVFPAIYQMSGSMQTVSDASNDRMRTEIKIICESANQTDYSMNVYLKNSGDQKVIAAHIGQSDVYFGTGDAMEGRAAATARPAPPGSGPSKGATEIPTGTRGRRWTSG